MAHALQRNSKDFIPKITVWCCLYPLQKLLWTCSSQTVAVFLNLALSHPNLMLVKWNVTAQLCNVTGMNGVLGQQPVAQLPGQEALRLLRFVTFLTTSLKVPISSKFLFSHLILHFLQWTSAKQFFDLDKKRFCYECLKTWKSYFLGPVPLITASTCTELWRRFRNVRL